MRAPAPAQPIDIARAFPFDMATARRIGDLLPVAMYCCDAPSGRITFYNAQAAALWGREPDVGATDERFCGSFRLWRASGELLPHEQTPMAFALREGREFRNEDVVIERPDHSRIRVLVNIDPIRDAGGRVVGAVNVFHDVTALQEATDALRDSEQRFRTMIDALPAAIYTTDAQGRLTHFNPAAVKFSGAPRNWAPTSGACRGSCTIPTARPCRTISAPWPLRSRKDARCGEQRLSPSGQTAPECTSSPIQPHCATPKGASSAASTC
ncbi:MAG: PAS domain-containing protein [Gammaproteobacteria bacterium]|nr:PAS domain-containing protein [Gammaproteobacteria bacterium]